MLTTREAWKRLIEEGAEPATDCIPACFLIYIGLLGETNGIGVALCLMQTAEMPLLARSHGRVNGLAASADLVIAVALRYNCG
jgi:hypothetical protein